MIKIEQVIPKVTSTGKQKVIIEASGKTYHSWDRAWLQCVGREVPLSAVSKDKNGYLNLPNVADVFATADPRASVPVLPAPLVGNGIQAQRTATERYEILSRQVAEILAILRNHFK